MKQFMFFFIFTGRGGEGKEGFQWWALKYNLHPTLTDSAAMEEKITLHKNAM